MTRTGSRTGWCRECRSRPGWTRARSGIDEHAGARIGGRIATWTRIGGSHPPSLGWPSWRAPGPGYLDAERASIDVRSRRHPRRRGGGLRRGRVDHHRADSRTDVHHPSRPLGGNGLRAAAGVDRRVHRVRSDLVVDAAVGDAADAARHAISRRPGYRVLHPADSRVHLAEYAAEVLGIRHRGLRVESRAVVEYFRLSRGLVCRARLMALDLLAERAARPPHVTVPAPGHSPQADHAAALGPVRPAVRRDRTCLHLWSARSRQSARLAELGPGVGTDGGGRLSHGRLLHP